MKTVHKLLISSVAAAILTLSPLGSVEHKASAATSITNVIILPNKTGILGPVKLQDRDYYTLTNNASATIKFAVHSSGPIVFYTLAPGQWVNFKATGYVTVTIGQAETSRFTSGTFSLQY